MCKLYRIDIERSKEILEDIKSFAEKLKKKFGCDVYLYGSFAQGKFHEGSDVDLIIVGDFKERFFERIEKILEMTNLPVEPLVYTKEEFAEMKKKSGFIKEIMKSVVKL